MTDIAEADYRGCGIVMGCRNRPGAVSLDHHQTS
ncbi:hypothetical protein GGR90_002083 [Sphingopyxis italica]|uniref:Uncharacterized protein n=1 Tax=Sphingopyxis italica TaxID=1129133 RepID=A0A7X5XS33_9SPHN|nr:hypothetical protein [Sphingopyxis italica]